MKVSCRRKGTRPLLASNLLAAAVGRRRTCTVCGRSTATEVVRIKTGFEVPVARRAANDGMAETARGEENAEAMAFEEQLATTLFDDLVFHLGYRQPSRGE